VDGAAILSGDARQVLTVADSTPLAAGTGGGIAFRGKFSGASYTQGGFIQTEKSNSTSGNFAFDLVLGSRPHGGSPTERMRIDSNGNVGIGTTSPNLHGWTTAVTLNTSSNGGYEIGQSGTKYGAFALQGDGRVQLTNFTANPLTFQTNNTERMRIDSSGNVGIGTSSPSATLDIVGASGGNGTLYVSRTAGATLLSQAQPALGQFGTSSNHNLQFLTNGNGRMTIDTNGRVGIGTSSPAHKLHVADATTPEIIVEDTTNNVKAVLGADNSVGRIGTDTNHPVTFRTNDTERMRIDSSGNLLVGKTSADTTTKGHHFNNSVGYASHVASNNTALYVNRLSSDGNVLQVQKDGTPVGSIGVNSGDQFYFAAADGMGIKVDSDNTCVEASNSSGADNDATVNLGSAGTRWKDLYLSGGIEIENGSGNVGVGKNALNSNTASNNTAVGYQALYQNTTASSNTATGYQSMYYTNTGGANVAMGYLAGHNIRGGESNVALGYRALVTNQSGSNNTAVGRQALQAATSINNTALGYHAGYGITNGDQNVAVGYGSGPQSGTGSGALNVYIGSRAGAATSTHSGNCIVGPQAGLLSTGSANTFIGSLVYGVTVGPGAAMTTGSKNTIIGGFSGNAYGLDIRTSNNRIVLSDGDGNIGLYIDNSQDAHFDGNVIAYSTTISDERLKTDIVKIESALDKVDQINGYTFTYTADGKKSAGVIAQEVEKVLPSAVNETAMPLKTGNDNLYKSVQYDQLIGLLVEAIKELKAEVAELKGQ
jgi:hypothetical protein